MTLRHRHSPRSQEAQLSALPAGPAVAVVVCRDGRLPAGAEVAVEEAGGAAVVAGTGADAAAAELSGAAAAWWWETPAGLGSMAVILGDLLEGCGCIVLPASPDGRDLAPRLAAIMGRPLLAGAVGVRTGDDGTIRAELLRVDGQVVVPAEVAGPAVATIVPAGPRSVVSPPANGMERRRLPLPSGADRDLWRSAAADPEVVAMIAPDPATMDLADATRVLGGGAGLVSHATTDARAKAMFALLTDVAAALGASAGATRVVTDAGWAGHERQIGTTGVAVDPELYVAFGVSGASQHTGGLGTPGHIVSINTDPSCPMTALANLGLVTDAARLLIELAGRLGVEIPPELEMARG